MGPSARIIECIIFKSIPHKLLSAFTVSRISKIRKVMEGILTQLLLNLLMNTFFLKDIRKHTRSMTFFTCKKFHILKIAYYSTCFRNSDNLISLSYLRFLKRKKEIFSFDFKLETY